MHAGRCRRGTGCVYAPRNGRGHRSHPAARNGAPATVAILWLILAVVLAVWLIGFLADVAGNVIHVLLIVALALLLYNLLTGRRAV